MSKRLVSFDRADLPQCPVEIADEVELYARESGRTGSLRFVPLLFVNGCIMRGAWVVDLTLRVNDARMKLWRDGKAEKPPVESVWLWETNPRAGAQIPGTGGLREPPKIGLDIQQMGAAGVREFFERGNSWSGRGEFNSPMEALKSSRAYNATLKQKIKDDARDENQQEAPGFLKFLLGKRHIPVSLPWKKKAS